MGSVQERSTGQRRIAAALVMVVGVFIVLLAFVPENLFPVGTAFEEMIDDFRPMLEEEAIATARADVQGLGAVYDEFTTQVLPGMAQALGISPDELNANMGTNFPAVAAGVGALPTIVPTFEGLIDSLDSQRDLFASADAIPTKSLPAQTVPWGIVLAGLATVGVGVFMFLRPGRIGAYAVLGLAVLLVVVPVILTLMPKSADADELNENLEPIYTQETVDGARQALTVVGAMGFQIQDEMLPSLAQQLGQTPEEFGAFIGSNFPVTAATLQDLPTTFERFELFVGNFENNLDNYETLRPVKFLRIITLIVIGGVVVGLLAVWGGWAATPGKETAST